MCVCMCVYICTGTHAHTHTYTHTHTRARNNIYINIYEYTHMYVHMYNDVCTCANAHTQTQKCMPMHRERQIQRENIQQFLREEVSECCCVQVNHCVLRPLWLWAVAAPACQMLADSALFVVLAWESTKERRETEEGPGEWARAKEREKKMGRARWERAGVCLRCALWMWRQTTHTCELTQGVMRSERWEQSQRVPQFSSCASLLALAPAPICPWSSACPRPWDESVFFFNLKVLLRSNLSKRSKKH